MSDQIQLAVKTLVEDTNFTMKLEELINEIMKDGKIDFSDTPQLILLVVESYNNVKNVKLLYNQIPLLVKGVTSHILENKNLIPENKKENFDKMIETAVKLVMVQPRVKRFCFNKFPCCK